MFEFTAETKKVLIESGWYAGRHINIDTCKDALTKANYKLSQRVAQFLSEFDGLRIKFYRPEIPEYAELNLNCVAAAEGVNALWPLDNYYHRTGQKDLCVIGQAFSNHLTLMMAVDGMVYGGYDDFLCFIANSGEEAIEAICSNQTFKEIPDLPGTST